MFDTLILLCLRLYERFGSSTLIAILASPVVALSFGLWYDWQLAGYMLLTAVAFCTGFAVVDATFRRVADIRQRQNDPAGYAARLAARNITHLSVNAALTHKRMLSPRKRAARLMIIAGALLVAGAYALHQSRSSLQLWGAAKDRSPAYTAPPAPAPPAPARRSKGEVRAKTAKASEPTPSPTTELDAAEPARPASSVEVPPTLMQEPVLSQSVQLSEAECHERILAWRNNADTFVPSECQQQLRLFKRDLQEQEARVRQQQWEDKNNQREAERYKDERRREQDRQRQEHIEGWVRTGEGVYGAIRRRRY